MSVLNTGDFGRGGACFICGAECSWKDSMNEIEHKKDCAYLIAKDLNTNQP